METEPIIQFDAVTKAYAAIGALDLAIASGSFVAIVGASGSGKTTLLKMVNRLIAPDAGRVMVAGEDVALAEPAVLRRRIGYVFQGVGLFPHMTVAENIAIVPRLLGWDEARRAARVAELLALVELPVTIGDRPPRSLSGGQRQRIGVARALAAEPWIVLMDEPFGALDPLTRASLAEACRRLHERLGLTTLMVTHDIAEALLIADRVVVMRAGAVVADASPAGLLAGHGDAGVAALVDVPRRQAERLAALSGIR